MTNVTNTSLTKRYQMHVRVCVHACVHACMEHPDARVSMDSRPQFSYVVGSGGGGGGDTAGGPGARLRGRQDEERIADDVSGRERCQA